MRYRLAEGAFAERVGGETVITHANNDVSILNESALDALEVVLSCDSDAPEEDVARAYVEIFHIEERRAYRDAQAVVGRLRAQNIIKPITVNGGGQRQVTRRSFVAGFGALGLSLISPSIAFDEETAGEEAARIAGQTCGECCLGGYSDADNDPHSGKRLWIDSLGRQVYVPEEIQRVAPYGPYAQAILESLDPGMVVQVSTRGSQASAVEGADSINARFEETSSGNADIDACAVESGLPDIILDIVDSVGRIDESLEIASDELGVPVVHVVVALEDLPQAYRTCGELLGKQERGSELADCSAQILFAFLQGKALIEEGMRKKVYFGQGSCGLDTRGSDTLLNSVLELIGAENAAKDLSGKSALGLELSVIVEWNPDLVVLELDEAGADASSENFARVVWSEGALSGFAQAVEVPTLPCSWIGRSPFHMQTIGALWLANALYPEIYDFDLKEVAANYWEVFFGIELTEADLEAVCAKTVEPGVICDNLDDLCSNAISGNVSAAPEAEAESESNASVEYAAYAAPSVEGIAADVLSATVASVSSGGGSSGGSGGGTGSGGSAVGTESNPKVVTAGVRTTVTNKSTYWFKCSIAGAAHIVVDCGGVSSSITIKVSDGTMTPYWGTWTEETELEQRASNYNTSVFTVGIVSSSRTTIVCMIEQNEDKIIPGYENGSKWTYDGISAADINLIYDFIWVMGPEKAATVANLIGSDVYDDYEDDIENAVAIGGSVLFDLALAIVTRGLLPVSEALVGATATVLTEIVSCNLLPDIKQEIQDQIVEKGAMDSKGHFSYGVAIYKALIGGMGVRRYRVDRWDDFDTNDNGEYDESDVPLFYAPLGSKGIWE